MPEPEKPWPKETWVCTGTRVPLEGGGRGVVFRPIYKPESLEDSATLGPERIYGTKNFRSVRVGAVYEIEAEEKQCRAQTLRFLRPYGDREAAQEWIAREEVRKLEDERKKSLADAKKSNALADLFEPVRKVYLRHGRSTAFELMLLRYLRTGNL